MAADACVLLVGEDAIADRAAERIVAVEGVVVLRVLDLDEPPLMRGGGVDCAVVALPSGTSDGVRHLVDAQTDAPTVVLSDEDADLPGDVDRVPPDDLDGLERRVRAAVDDQATEPPLPSGVRELVEANPVGIVFVRDGVIQYANPAFAELHGRDRASLAGIDPLELLVEEDRGRAATVYEAGLPAGEQRRQRFTVRGGDDETAEVEIHATRLQAGGVLSSVVDVTERARRRETVTTLHDATVELMAARDPEAVAWLAVETARDVLDLPFSGVLLWDDEESLLRPAAVTTRGRQVLGPPPTFERGEGIAGRAFETGETIVLDDAQSDPRGKGGDDIRSYCVIPLGEHGTVIVASPEVGEFDDFSVEAAELLAAAAETALDRIGHERALRARERELERQNEQLEAFASVVSHDLRNPLNVVLGATEHARETGDLEPLSEVAEAAERMDALVDDLLSLARQGRVVGETEAVDLQSAAEAAWEHCETGNGVAEGSTGTLAVDSSGTLLADGNRLRELLENLFRNAGDHGGPEVTVSVGVLGGGDGFFVADDGPGIPEADRGRVFEHGYTTDDDGTGLGLAIVRKIADAHDWEVQVTESDAGGTRFEFTGVEFA